MQKTKLDKIILLCLITYILAIVLGIIAPAIEVYLLGKKVYQISRCGTRIREYRKERKKLPLLQDKEKKVKLSIKACKEKIRDLKDMFDIIGLAIERAKEYKITILEITPDKPKDFKVVDKDKNILYVPINIEAEGNYHDLAEFVDALENCNLYIEVKQVLMSTYSPSNRFTLLLGVLFKE